ncbi:MAG: exodeoxyribonuclease III [Vicinamibacterales bacterium]|nr:exodeoxyribonuclease III [Vicinamibacterales bacterium]
MRIATWNVNGIRARQAQVLDWLSADQPDVACLQEIKAAPDQVPPSLWEHPDYWTAWHGAGGYSGVALLVRKERAPERPAVTSPAFDFETRILSLELAGTTIASVYVPNGGKDFAAKMRFLESLRAYAASFAEAGRTLVLCGDMNVALTDLDVHPKERKPTAIGQLPEERALFGQVVGSGLVDVGRTLDPDNDAYFTWWPPWRSMRQRNIGWRIDYVLASTALAATASACPSFREIGTSDHAPVVAAFGT